VTEDTVGVWKGANHAFFELLAPAWNDTGLAARTKPQPKQVDRTTSTQVQTDDLTYVSSPNGSRIPYARVIDRPVLPHRRSKYWSKDHERKGKLEQCHLKYSTNSSLLCGVRGEVEGRTETGLDGEAEGP
jgi:hypothetical protein